MAELLVCSHLLLQSSLAKSIGTTSQVLDDMLIAGDYSNVLCTMNMTIMVSATVRVTIARPLVIVARQCRDTCLI